MLDLTASRIDAGTGTGVRVDPETPGEALDPGDEQRRADRAGDRMRLAKGFGGRGAGVTLPGEGLGLPPEHVRLEERRRPGGDGRSDGGPACRIVLTRRARQLGLAERHPPADLVCGKVIRLAQPRGRGPVALDHVARRIDRRLGAGRIARGSRPDRDVRGGGRGGDRELSEVDRRVHLDEPLEPFASRRQRGRRIAGPQGDLGPDRVEIDDELGVRDAAHLGPGDLEVASSRGQVAGQQGQVGPGDMEVDRAEARQHIPDVPRDQLGRLRVASEVDEVLGRVDLEERAEPEVAAELADALHAGQRDLERFLHEAAHLEHAAEVGVGARDLRGVARPDS